MKCPYFFYFLLLVTSFAFLTTSKSPFLAEKRPDKWSAFSCQNIEFLKIPSSASLFHKPDGVYFPLKKRIWNPTVMDISGKKIMLFRNTETGIFFSLKGAEYKRAIGEIHAVYLDEKLNPISKEIQVTCSKEDGSLFEQPQDPRLFQYEGKIFCLLVDKITKVSDPHDELYLTELTCTDQLVSLRSGKRLIHPNPARKSERNWMPFTQGGNLYAIYSTSPYEVLKIDPLTKETKVVKKDSLSLQWQYGFMSGSTLPIELNGKNLTFFHSFSTTLPKFFKRKPKSHYFFGAYTFENKPPFSISAYTPLPIYDKKLYNVRTNPDRIVFPTCIVQEFGTLKLLAGVNDRKIAIITIDQKTLESAMETYEKRR